MFFLMIGRLLLKASGVMVSTWRRFWNYTAEYTRTPMTNPEI